MPVHQVISYLSGAQPNESTARQEVPRTSDERELSSRCEAEWKYVRRRSTEMSWPCRAILSEGKSEGKFDETTSSTPSQSGRSTSSSGGVDGKYGGTGSLRLKPRVRYIFLEVMAGEIMTKQFLVILNNEEARVYQKNPKTYKA